jgi:DNA polymerase-3 subunit epsilon/ATP-dependent DNA helicase DinG
LAQSYVALDIETTGLDLDVDRVTEVGAVRFDCSGQEIDTFQSLVNPGRPIPAFVEKLTGLSDDMVRSAPRLGDLAATLESFVGDATIVGQNIGFDLAHLRRAGLAFPGGAVDTAELSRILLPGRQPRGLIDLAGTLGVEATEHHRALTDAQTAARVFVALLQRARGMDTKLRLQLARLLALHDARMAEALAGEDWAELPEGERALPSVRKAPEYEALVKREPLVATPAGKAAAVIRAAAAVLQGYEERAEQLEMAEAVREAMSEGGHYLVEAGTGVGKSLAYLVPAALHALANGTRVVVSTNTINLQEQLLTKDIPAMRRMLVEAGVLGQGEELRVALLKGRGNYLCLRRWIASYSANLGDPDFARLAAAMLLWLPTTETGDRSELGLDGRDHVTWARFSAQETDCLQRPNAQVREGNCFLQRARKAAESAHIVVVNHALLLADIASGGSALPAFDHLVIDEAHNLEETATQQFGGTVTARLLTEALEGLHRPRGRDSREGGVVSLLRAFPEGPLTEAAERISEAVAAVHDKAKPFFAALSGFLPGGEEDRVAVDSGLRTQPAWSEPERLWNALDGAIEVAIGRTEAAAQLLGGTAPVEEPDAIAGEITTASRKLLDLRLELARLMNSTDPGTVVWLAKDRDRTATLHSAPLEVGTLLWEELLSRKRTVVATSATLSAAGSMEFAARRLGFEAPEIVRLGSPFDYERAVILGATEDIPEPGQQGYDEAIASSITELVRASEGRALVLFTSHASLKRTAERLREPLERDGIAVLAQGIDGPPRQLTENLIAQSRSVILGTSSFWEGVDIRGDALSLLVIARLPFAVPTDPVYRARSEQYDDPFRDYSLPSAILRFRQGFGRLIRDRWDRGAVVVLDRRIFEKRYGQQFVDALPRCRRIKAETPVIARHVREWLA